VLVFIIALLVVDLLWHTGGRHQHMSDRLCSRFRVWWRDINTWRQDQVKKEQKGKTVFYSS
jgi:hypothetical protein